MRSFVRFNKYWEKQSMVHVPTFLRNLWDAFDQIFAVFELNLLTNPDV